jgi:hypothetical protein
MDALCYKDVGTSVKRKFEWTSDQTQGSQGEKDFDMIKVSEINELHRDTVARWHEVDIDNEHDGLFGLICKQHSFNFQLWHEEDIARSREVTDEKIAQVKRAIDGFNQNRNDWIEKVDDEITLLLAQNGVHPSPNARLNTETPGSSIDRLSIMSLRLYHMNEQLDRKDASPEHTQSVQQKIAVCAMQHTDLSQSLQQLIDDIFSGEKLHKTYRQFKMYNDPTLNPYLYQAKAHKAA